MVGSIDPDEIEVHIQDSLAAADSVPSGARLADLGSGAGFPGVPIALARPDVRVTLLEVRERRVSFLRHVARSVDAEIEVLRGRIEDGPPEPFDLVTLRAVASPEQAVRLGVPWAKPDGEVWIWTTTPANSLPWAPIGRIDLGDRGAVLRFHASAVSRGTSDDGS